MTRDLLRHCAGFVLPVINGYAAYLVEISKAHQLRILEGVGVRYPRSIVIARPVDALEAAERLPFPLLVKPNVGGSGASILRVRDRAALIEAIVQNRINLGIDHTGIVQQYLRPRGGFIVRVEVLDGQILYALKIYPQSVGGVSRPRPGSADHATAVTIEAGTDQEEEAFNLCPADICQAPLSNGSQPPDVQGYCLGETQPKRSLRVEAYQPPPEITEQILLIARAARLDLGGIEYLINDDDGEPTFYDINALSNFVTNAVEVVGFDPFVRLVDFILARAAQVAGAREPEHTRGTAHGSVILDESNKPVGRLANRQPVEASMVNQVR